MTGSEGLPLFTAEEATRTLPLVSRIATDIAHENDQLQELLPELRRARSRAGSRHSSSAWARWLTSSSGA